MKRLTEAGIVRVSGFEMSMRGKKMKKYRLHKPSLLIIVDSSIQDKKKFRQLLKEKALKKLRERILLSILIFISFFLTSNIIVQMITQKKIIVQLVDNYIRFYIHLEGPPELSNPFPMNSLIISTIFGLIVTTISWFILSRKLVSLNIDYTERP